MDNEKYEMPLVDNNIETRWDSTPTPDVVDGNFFKLYINFKLRNYSEEVREQYTKKYCNLTKEINKLCDLKMEELNIIEGGLF